MQASSEHRASEMRKGLQTGPASGKKRISPQTVSEGPSVTIPRIQRRSRTGLHQKRTTFLTSIVVGVALLYLIAQYSSHTSSVGRGLARRLAKGVSNRIESSYYTRSCTYSKFFLQSAVRSYRTNTHLYRRLLAWLEVYRFVTCL